MWHDDIDGVWDDETQRYYYPEYVADTDGMPTAVTFTGRHGEKVKQRASAKKDVLPESAIEIARECDRIKATLIDKHLQYGRSATEPVRIFSKADADEQLLVRIDDKLSRIVRGDGSGDEDAIFDLIGYLVLLRVVRSA